MPPAHANGIVIEYEVSGPAKGRPLLLIHGIGAQLIRWPEALLDGFAAAGFRVIRFDNRDVGLSSHMDDAPVPDLAAVMEARRRGLEPDLPYSVTDLAADAVGLLDALGVAQAHIFGVSLGGMIAQALAIAHPERVLSLNIVMSQSGNPDLPPPDPVAISHLAAIPPNPAEDLDAYLKHSVRMNRALGGPDYPIEETVLRDFAARAAKRAYNPPGAARQMAASRGAPDRRPALRQLAIPTLVIHGADDPLIPLAGGEDIARNVKGAWLLAINGMGHDLPPQLVDLFVTTVTANCARENRWRPLA